MIPACPFFEDFQRIGQSGLKHKEGTMKNKKGNESEDINDILKDMRKNIKPSTGPLTSIDPKKLAKVAEDVKVAKEIEKMLKRTFKEDDKS